MSSAVCDAVPGSLPPSLELSKTRSTSTTSNGENAPAWVAERGAKIIDATSRCGTREATMLRARSYEDRVLRIRARDATAAIADIFQTIPRGGVAPLDVKIGNIVVGSEDGAPYGRLRDCHVVSSWAGSTQAYRGLARETGGALVRRARDDLASRLHIGEK